MASPEITLEAVPSVTDIPAAEWDACANPAGDPNSLEHLDTLAAGGAQGEPCKPAYNPFVSHAFFAAAEASLDAAFVKCVGGTGKPRDLLIKGRTLHVPREGHGVARFSFAELCEQPLGASDYLRLAHEYHTLFIDRIPMMDYGDRNAAKRFIALIDTLYDNAVKLMASAAAEPQALYRASEGFEAMEFARTASRLFEMGSETYLALPHGRSDSTASGATTGLVET